MNFNLIKFLHSSRLRSLTPEKGLHRWSNFRKDSTTREMDLSKEKKVHLDRGSVKNPKSTMGMCVVVFRRRDRFTTEDSADVEK